MSRLIGFYRSRIGKKVIVAVTGGLMLAFLVGHVTGNMKVFLPNPEPGVPDIDAYSAFLRVIGEPIVPHGGVLWIVRLGLLLTVALFITINFIVDILYSVLDPRVRLGDVKA